MKIWPNKIKDDKGEIFEVREYEDNETDGFSAPSSHGFVNLFQNGVFRVFCGVTWAKEHMLNKKEKAKLAELENLVSRIKLTFKKSKFKDVYRIKFDGEFITTNSGKSAWAGIGNAKNAFVCHLDSTILYSEKQKMGFKSGKELAQYLFDNGEVEYIKL